MLAKDRPRTTDNLRYDRIMLCTDQDVDGAHITGLVINACDVIMPELMRANPDFIQRLATPLVKAWPKRGSGAQPKEFLSEPEFDSWFEELPQNERTSYEIKYFKGLGTSTARDAKHVFANIDRYLIAIDCTADSEVLGDFFDSERAAKRREYLALPPAGGINYNAESLALEDYLMGEVLPFSRYDNERSIAHVVDGLKPAQRKILWVLRTKYSDVRTPTLKVAQLSGTVAQRTQYKHGEESLNGTEIRMAQDFPTCGNNINLLVPEGMFGNRKPFSAQSFGKNKSARLFSICFPGVVCRLVVGYINYP